MPEHGDQVLFGVALTVDGHWGHGIRMGSIGPQKPEHRALVGHVEAMLEVGRANIAQGQAFYGIGALEQAKALAPNDWRPLSLLGVGVPAKGEPASY